MRISAIGLVISDLGKPSEFDKQSVLYAGLDYRNNV
jgi:hypothetical protein